MAESVSVDPGLDAIAQSVTAENSQELLIRAYELIGAALPLAVERLRTGGVTLSDQQAFWQTFLALEELLTDVEPDYDALLSGYVDDPDEPTKCSFDDLAADMRRRAMK